MPDYFDRLLARHSGGAPAASAAGGAGGPVRVRPRLPGPYERIESLRADAPPAEESVFRVPAPPRPAARQGEPVLREREVRTDGHTVVRTEVAPPEEHGRPAAVPPGAAVLRPAAQIAPVPRPAAPGIPARP
ncbi:MAG: hypothetical protein ACRDP3_02070, partial [Streptomyces sp.]